MLALGVVAMGVFVLCALAIARERPRAPSDETPPTTWPPSFQWPSPPMGWRLMRSDEVTDEVGRWARSVLDHEPHYAMWSTHTATLAGVAVLGRIEWHPSPDLDPSKTHRGVTMYRGTP